MAILVKKGFFTSKQITGCHHYSFTDEGIKIVKITQLNQDGSLDLSDCSFIEAKRLDEFNDILIKEGDILMALTGGTIGKIIRCEEIKEPLLQNYRVGNFIPFRGLDKGFLFYLLSSQLTLDQIDYYINYYPVYLIQQLN